MELVALVRIFIYAIFLLIPEGTESGAVIAYMIIYFYQMVHLFTEDKRLQKGKYSIINFNVFFFTMYTFCTFLIPFFHLIGFNDYSIFSQMIHFDVRYIPKALFMSSIAVEVYSLFYLKGLCKKNRSVNVIPLHILKRAIKVSTFLSFFILGVFLVDFLKARAGGMLDVGGQVTALVTCFTILPVFLYGYANKYYYHYSLAKFLLTCGSPLFCQLFVIVCMVSIGDRLIAVCLLSGLAVIINEYVYKIKTIVFLGALVVAFLGLFLIGLTRGTDMSYSEGMTMYQSSEERFVVFQDVYPANATLLMGTEVVDQKGYYKPMRIIPYVLNPIPFIPSFIKNTFFDGEIASAMYLTMYNRKLSTIGESGIGTHALVDVYVSWGILGVIVLFGFLGYVVGMSYGRRDNIFYMIVYVGLMSWAVFMPRESLFDPYRNIVWLLFIASVLLRGFSKRSRA